MFIKGFETPVDNLVIIFQAVVVLIYGMGDAESISDILLKLGNYFREVSD